MTLDPLHLYSLWPATPVRNSMPRISSTHMIYGGRRYPTLIFFGIPHIECIMPIATLTLLHPDLISRPSSAFSNSDSDFDSRAVDYLYNPAVRPPLRESRLPHTLSTSLARTINIVMVGKLGFYTIKPLVASGIPPIR